LAPKQKRITFPFKLVRNLVVVEAYVNNKGPYNFILDTGVGIFLITDPSLVDTLGITKSRSIEIQGLGSSERMEAWITPQVSIDVHGAKCKALPAAILKKDFFGLSAYAGLPIHGLLGYEFFASFGVKLDFAENQVTAIRYDKLKPLRNADKIPMKIEERKPYIEAKADLADGRNLPVKLIVDLGAGHPLMLENLVSGYIGMPNKFIIANLGVGLGGPINGYLSRIDQLTLGRFRLKNVVTSFPAKDETKTEFIYRVKRDGNMGIGILRKFAVLFDYQHELLYLRKSGRYPEPFEHDMSGIEFYSSGEKFDHIIISRVEPGSAGDDAGLVEGDEIISLNFKKVADMTVEEIDALFKSKDGRGILMEIGHGKETDRVILTLKKRL
ncbi:MAG: aspartyl protease family protein, partial [Mucilaginibacter polytrichastri]|nr:aspartyl protease family protein [Mucilaginibacter polytrichastri]